LLVSLGLHFGFGLALFYGVQKFFEEIEKKLNVRTTKEIAAWLLDLRPTKTIQSWHSTFPKIFNRAFGEKHLSWKCFRRSCVITAVATFVAMVGFELFWPKHFLNNDQMFTEARFFALVYFASIFGSTLFDYISLWKTRYLINLSQRLRQVTPDLLFLMIDIITTFALATCAVFVGSTILTWSLHAIHAYNLTPISIETAISNIWNYILPVLGTPWNMPWQARWTFIMSWYLPAFFGRLWLLAYVGSGLLLKVARRFDIGFRWFNRHFDVKNHPLQCIGLVAGSCLALGYWILAAIRLIP
jgi:hypothetical protein